MEFSTYVRKPFLVNAVRVTDENIEELAPLAGRLVSLPDGTRFIRCDPKKIPNGIKQIYPGFWMTKMGNNVRAYAAKIFFDQFVAVTPDVKQHIDGILENAKDGSGTFQEVGPIAG